MTLIDKYLTYIGSIRRFSAKTVETYSQVLSNYTSYMEVSDDEALLASLTPEHIRNYMVYLIDGHGLGARTTNLHMSVLSGLCRFLQSEGRLESNPVRVIPKPKQSKKLPVVYRHEAMSKYFSETEAYASKENASLVVGSDKLSFSLWRHRRDRLVIRILYDTGIRRSELISLNVSSIDFSRRVMRVLGKGNKMREIPLSDSILEEFLLYLLTTAKIWGSERLPSDPLVVTEKGARLYPMAVQRIVEAELSSVGITGRRSPHALRHTIATELLDEGSDLNSIKELLGHSSLAATQVYTHSSVEKLKKSYINAHPRAKRGG